MSACIAGVTETRLPLRRRGEWLGGTVPVRQCRAREVAVAKAVCLGSGLFGIVDSSWVWRLPRSIWAMLGGSGNVSEILADMSFADRLGLWWQQPAQTVEETTTKAPLPDSVTVQVGQALTDLPAPSPFADTIRTALVETIAAWQQAPERSNALVILGSPAEPLDCFVRQSLLEWDALDERSLKFLSWKAIPARPTAFVSGLRETIGEQLKEKVEPRQQIPLRFSADGVQLQAEPRSRRGVVLPCLTQYFIRCIEGLEGVLYLRKEILKDPQRFWIIGCNHWAWQYLSYVSQMDAYFEHTVTVPPLSAEQLRDWLAPARSLLEQSLPRVKRADEALEEGYFEALARVSMGLSSVAAGLWLQSLQVNSVANLSSHSDRTSSNNGPGGSAHEAVGGQWFGFERPSTAKLPGIAPGDRALLYSLLLHDGLQLQHLALSLGVAESKLLARVKELLRLGVIRRQGRSLSVRPDYYPVLRSDLARNNFLVGES